MGHPTSKKKRKRLFFNSLFYNKAIIIIVITVLLLLGTGVGVWSALSSSINKSLTNQWTPPYQWPPPTGSQLPSSEKLNRLIAKISPPWNNMTTQGKKTAANLVANSDYIIQDVNGNSISSKQYYTAPICKPSELVITIHGLNKKSLTSYGGPPILI